MRGINDEGGDVYSRYFRNSLDVSSVEAARESVAQLDRTFNYFERLGDRAGQERAMRVAMTGANRARWAGDYDVARVFSEWLVAHLPAQVAGVERRHDASLRFAMILKLAFPWLGDEDYQKSVARERASGIAETLQEIYVALVAGDADDNKGGES
jgi:hypothetical protein